MEIVIDVEDPTPLFSQLIQQVKQAVVSNLIQPGDAFAVNPPACQRSRVKQQDGRKSLSAIGTRCHHTNEGLQRNLCTSRCQEKLHFRSRCSGNTNAEYSYLRTQKRRRD